MPNISFDNVQESTGVFTDIEPGAYTLVITKVEPHPEDEYVRLYWDVAEGDSKGAYAQSQYPPSDILSWKQGALGFTKHKLHVIADSNGAPQQVVEQAFQMDDWKRFVGKKFGAIVRRRLYTAGPNSKTPGADKTAVEVAAWMSPAELAEGKWSKNLLNDRDQRDKTKAAQPAQQSGVVTVPASFSEGMADPDLASEDIPF